jgi:four helix bundle protein
MEGKGPYFERVTDLRVYQLGFECSMDIFRLSKTFPVEERYSMTDQIRKSSRSVCSNLAEGWAKRIYPAAFANKVNDAEGEALETQTWLMFAHRSGYMSRETAIALYKSYDEIVSMLIAMRRNPDRWRPTK